GILTTGSNGIDNYRQTAGEAGKVLVGRRAVQLYRDAWRFKYSWKAALPYPGLQQVPSTSPAFFFFYSCGLRTHGYRHRNRAAEERADGPPRARCMRVRVYGWGRGRAHRVGIESVDGYDCVETRYGAPHRPPVVERLDRHPDRHAAH